MEGDKGGSGSHSGTMSDGERPLMAQYSSPGVEPTGGLSQNPADLWVVDREDSLAKRSKTDAAEGASSSCQLHSQVDLCPLQREVLNKVVSSLDVSNTSAVITNPLQRDNPIVYVTKPWEDMCGFKYNEAVGRNPRVTQGHRSDPNTIGMMSSALREQRACKVMMLNYRGGDESRPFFNMLSISPIVHQGKLQLYLANLQDYSYHMSKLVSMPPTQFCRSAEHHQSVRRLPPSDKLSVRAYARPAVFELGETSSDGTQLMLTEPGHGGAAGGGPLQLRRLGWSNLSLEPEHLTDRVVDALHQLEARYERVESNSDGDDVFVVNAEISGVACRVMITADPNDPNSYRIACTRLGGDTFVYHDVFRQLRKLLGDAVDGATPLQRGGSAGSVGMRRPMPAPPGVAPLPLGLAPLPSLPMARDAVDAGASAASSSAATSFGAGSSSSGAGPSGS